GQVGVLVSRTNNVTLDNVLVQNVETAYKLDGGPTGVWNSETTLINPIAINVVYGLYVTASGGAVTDIRCCSGGYFYGPGATTGQGIHADAMQSSTFSAFSLEHFSYGIVLSGTSDSDTFFGGRLESSGP